MTSARLSSDDLLSATDHRPWPLPARPWAVSMVWHDLLFAHWPLAADELRARVPPSLELDLFEGQAWVGLVPFGMRGVRPRWAFSIPWLSNFLELNVRTYVRVGGKAGVYFFSLEAADPLAVQIARGWYRLPYFHARMSLRREADWIDYTCQRTHWGAPAARFEARYRPTGDVFRALAGSLEAWLTERYGLYTVDARGRAWRGDIHHRPWPLQPAEAEIRHDSLTRAHGLVLPDIPARLHFARELHTVAWALRPA